MVCGGWGFFGHRHINGLAIHMLPAEMGVFYKRHSAYLRDASVQPDRRRYAVAGEAECHFIDLDRYPPAMVDSLSETGWEEVVAWVGEDSIRAHGILPWNLVRVYRSLRFAFLNRDAARVLRLSAELGHYAGDAHVPLHATANYDGQLTGQQGLHGLWESRLPELHFEEYDFLLGPARFEPDVPGRIWEVVRQSQSMVDSVLMLERKLFRAQAPRKFAFESKGAQTVRVVSVRYAREYHRMLNGMVERRLRASVRLVADLWYSAWLEAGQPDLKDWRPEESTDESSELNRREWKEWAGKYLQRVRPHDADTI